VLAFVEQRGCLKLRKRSERPRDRVAGRLVRAVLGTILLLAAPASARDLWLYCQTNLLTDKNIDDLDRLWHRAQAAGYSHVLLADSKFARLGELDRHYFANVDRVKRIAAETHLQIIPAIFGIGYSNDLLSHDPNLAEGLPVKDTPFVVRGNVARVEADPPVALTKISFKDDTVDVAGNVATVRDNAGNARFVYKLALPPLRCYHVSAWIRTDHYTGGDIRIQPMGGNRPLQFQSLGVKPTQDWTQHHIVFDTLDHTEVELYFGIWGGGKGTLQWRDWRIEEVGLVNVLRRGGTPCVVQGYTEGKDYDRIEDPLLGNKPWAGEYTAWHEPPTIRTHGIPDGTHVRVSWFYPPIVGEGQVSICPSDPKTNEILADQARRVRELFSASGYMMSYDEIRCWNWDDACQSRQQDAGQLLADHVRASTKLLSGSDAYVWSDMFDPSHNAHGDYYLVRGDFAGSWIGLDPAVTIVNWNFAKRDQSLKFFADRGHKQVIAGYYDGNVDRIRQWLASANNVPGVVGVMYTTWQHKYDDLEAFAKLCRE
jgi:hypothetical protein